MQLILPKINKYLELNEPISWTVEQKATEELFILCNYITDKPGRVTLSADGKAVADDFLHLTRLTRALTCQW
jgi:hypothetical protein